ncbi:MAG: hypothetical protein I3J02_12290 [Prevotella sp.]|nr:hypothetical protein [Prevotella sp.]
MMMKKLSLFSLWLATLMVLSLSMLAHHHHFEEVCFVEEKCEMDGNFNDDHTTHPTSDREAQTDNCSIEQIKHIIKTENKLQQITQAVAKQSHLLYVFSPSIVLPTLDISLFSGISPVPAIRLLEVYIASGGLRAPPLS